MKQVLVKISFLFICFLSLIACSEVTDKELTDGSRGVFYQIDYEDTTVYLFGSIHLGLEEMYPLHGAVEQAYTESDIVGVEVDIHNFDFIEFQNFIVEHGLYQDGSTLADYLEEDLYHEIISIFGEQGLPEEAIAVLKPWALSMDLQGILYSDMGLDADLGIENYFLAKAAEDDKEVVSLETMIDQLQLFAMPSEETQIEMLRELVFEQEEGKSELENLVSHWMTGDLVYLETLREVEDNWSEDYLEYHTALTDVRDLAMAEKIDGFLQSNSTNTYFIIVGALHLVGENSIVDLLEQKGYEIIVPYE